MKLKIGGLLETEILGRIISQNIEDKSIICLTGDLGAGKTTLTQSIMKGLGIEEYITSPTYTIVNEYHEPKKVCQQKKLVLAGLPGICKIGFDDYLNQDAIIIIEWADIIEEIIPKDAIWIKILYTDKADERLIEIAGIDLEEHYENFRD